ncbi:hypothetical protein [Kitasatospora sp. HPMI-4]|uniref:hypothetical protein n=1 Tax=Kitasatospora sp. HPMI-4 TaxID=3448443 RepID=UPI003F1A50C2
MSKHLPSDPAWFLAQRGYGLAQLTPAQPSTMTRLLRWLTANPSKVWPAVTGVAGFSLARWLHMDGGTDVANIVTLGALAAATAAAGLVSASKQHGDSLLTASAFGISGALAVFDVAAATASTPLALAMALAPTALAYVLAALGWRQDRRGRETRRHEMKMEELRTYRELQLAELGIQQQREAGVYAVALVEAMQHRTGLDAATSTVPGTVLTSTSSVPQLERGPLPQLDAGSLLRDVLQQPTPEQVEAWTAARGPRGRQVSAPLVPLAYFARSIEADGTVHGARGSASGHTLACAVYPFPEIVEFTVGCRQVTCPACLSAPDARLGQTEDQL